MRVLERSDAYYEEKVEQRLKRVLSLESSPEYKLTVEELEKWVTESKAKKRIKQRRFMAIAASIVLMVSALVCVEYFHETNRYTAIAGKNDKQISEESGTVVVKDNDVGVEEHAGARKEKHTTWEAVLEAQERHPELLVPEYVPADWEFESIKINKNLNDIQAIYKYSFDNGTVFIQQIIGSREDAIKACGNSIITNEKRKIYIREENGKIATAFYGDTIMEIIGDVSDIDICKIADHIKKGED
ncbi:MAG: hypothetical protein RSD90_04490 [Anaerovoracaceae bacterium]